MRIVIRRSRLIVLGVIVLGVGVWFLVGWLVVTDADRIEQTIARVTESVEKGDVAAVTAELDDTFALGRISREGFRPWLEGALRGYGPVKVSNIATTVTIDKDLANVHVQSFVDEKAFGATHRIDWKLELIKRGEAWKLKGIRAFLQPHNQEISLASLESIVSP